MAKVRVPLTLIKENDMTSADDFKYIADFSFKGRFPDVIKRKQLRPDVVIHFKYVKIMYLIELTLPYECRVEEAHHYKTEKYEDFAN